VARKSRLINDLHTKLHAAFADGRIGSSLNKI